MTLSKREKRRLKNREPINPMGRGSESNKRFLYLVSEFTSLKSDEMIEALRQYYVEGIEEETIKLTVDAGNYSRANKRIIAAAIKVETIKQFDRDHFKS